MVDDRLDNLRFVPTNGTSGPCPICGMVPTKVTPVGDSDVIGCPGCGTYQITGSALAMCDDLTPRQRVLLSGFSRDSLLSGAPAGIQDDVLRASLTWPVPPLRERATRFLRWAVALLQFRPNDLDHFKPNLPLLKAGSYSADEHQAFRIAGILEEQGLVRSVSRGRPTGDGLAVLNNAEWQITPKGFLAAEDEEAARTLSTTGFGAMWFDPSMKPIWLAGLSAGISDAGFDPVRVDQVEHVGKIDDEIMVQIRKSRFVVADFTGHRTGVYFEAGFALGLGIPVIWTCRRDEMAKLHFDIRQYNCIDWENADDLRKRLSFRIESAVGRGPRLGAPVTS